MTARTMTILTKIAAICKKIDGKEVELMVTKEDFIYYWQRVK